MRLVPTSGLGIPLIFPNRDSHWVQSVEFLHVQPVHRVCQSRCPQRMMVTLWELPSSFVFGRSPCFKETKQYDIVRRKIPLRRRKSSAELCGTGVQPSRASAGRPKGYKYHDCSSRRLNLLFRVRPNHDIVRVLKSWTFPNSTQLIRQGSLTIPDEAGEVTVRSTEPAYVPMHHVASTVVLLRNPSPSLLAACCFAAKYPFAPPGCLPLPSSSLWAVAGSASCVTVVKALMVVVSYLSHRTAQHQPITQKPISIPAQCCLAHHFLHIPRPSCLVSAYGSGASNFRRARWRLPELLSFAGSSTIITGSISCSQPDIVRSSTSALPLLGLSEVPKYGDFAKAYAPPLMHSIKRTMIRCNMPHARARPMCDCA